MYLRWYDDSKRTVADKIRAGAEAFHQRFWKEANVCVCAPQNVAAVDGKVDEIAVQTEAWMTTPHMFLLGRSEEGVTSHSDYRQARGALHSTNDTPSEVIIRRMRDAG